MHLMMCFSVTLLAPEDVFYEMKHTKYEVMLVETVIS